MAAQKIQMRQLAQIGAQVLRWYREESIKDKPGSLSFNVVESDLIRILQDDQLEFEFEVKDEKVQVK